jgi:hypothetical protein
MTRYARLRFPSSRRPSPTSGAAKRGLLARDALGVVSGEGGGVRGLYRGDGGRGVTRARDGGRASLAERAVEKTLAVVSKVCG